MSEGRASGAEPVGLGTVLPGRGRRPSPFLLTAVLALLLATWRLVGLFDGPGAVPAPPAGPAVEETAGPAGPVAGEAAVAALIDTLLPVPAVEPAAGPPTAAAPAGTPSAGQPSPRRAVGGPPSAGAGDPLADVAAELLRRGAELDRRERDVVTREAAALAVETRLLEQLARLEGLKKELEALVARIRGQDEAEIAQLVKTYEAMKARSAALVFDQLALDLLLPIVRRMREAKLAAILAAMEPGKAKQLTAALAQTTALPKLP